MPLSKGGIAVASILGENSAPCPYRKGCNQATGVEFPAVPMNFDVADDCLGAYQRRRWHFFIAGNSGYPPNFSAGVVVGSAASPFNRTCARDRFKEFKSDRRRTWLSVKT